jgi:hypothetical protein
MRVDNPGPPVTPPGLVKSGQATENTQTKPKTGSDSEAKVPGVIRLLQEGHFKGVADVRLRINFQEQLGAISAASQSEAIQAGGDAIVGTVDETVNALLSSEELTDEQRTEIQNLLGIFADSVGQVSGESGDDFFDPIDSAFNDFSSALRDLLGITTEISVAEKNLPTDGVGATTGEESGGTEELSIEEHLNAIETAYNEAVANLKEIISQAGSILPELSPPNGNGVAYQKFVDILEGLHAEVPAESVNEGEGSSEVTPGSNSIDANI